MTGDPLDRSDSDLPPDVVRLIAEVKRLHAELDSRMRARWGRSLPLEELLSDRWERARGLGFGAGSSVYQSSYIYGDVSVGENTWIGPLTLLDGSGGLKIGSYCSISAGVQIYSHDTVDWALTSGSAPASRAAVVIGDSSYIGSQTVITKGVTIGDHCVVGACSLVNRDLPPFTVGFGVPCRVAGRVIIGDDGRPHVEIAR